MFMVIRGCVSRTSRSNNNNYLTVFIKVICKKPIGGALKHDLLRAQDRRRQPSKETV